MAFSPSSSEILLVTINVGFTETEHFDIFTLWPNWVSCGLSKRNLLQHREGELKNLNLQPASKQMTSMSLLALVAYEIRNTIPCNSLSLIYSSSVLSSQPVPLCHRRLVFRDIYGQSINSVCYTFPSHGQVYRQYKILYYI